MRRFNIVDEDLLFEKKLDALHVKECEACDTFFWSNHAICYCGKYESMVDVLKNIGEVPDELQDVAAFAKQLPHSMAVLNGLISVCCNTPCFHEDFLIRRSKVSRALHWLKKNNKYYKDIVIDLPCIMSLPDNGYFSNYLNTGESQDFCDEQDDPDATTSINRVVIPGIKNVPNTEKVKHLLKWPRISSEPGNEFNSPGYVAQAFPVLYPYGFGDLYEVKSKQVTARVYFQYLMQKRDRRFSKHKLFPYFALNSTLRWEALSLGTLYMKKKPEVKNINIEDLKVMVSESMSLPKSAMIYSSSIRTSKSYWMTRTYELDSLVDRFGLPTIFFSISAADHHWPRQFEIILCQSSSDLNVSDLSEKERQNLLKENADLCADYFYETASIFVVEVLVPFLKVLEYWFRFEWQMRGVGILSSVMYVYRLSTQLELIKVVEFKSVFIRQINHQALHNSITSKGEMKSKDLLNILKMIIFHSDVDESVKSVIQKLFVNLAADRDYSFQEVIHILKGHKLYECSRTIVVLNLSESDWQPTANLSVLSDEADTEEKHYDVLSAYSSRPQKFEKLTLLQ
ncbi:dTDP-glucose 4,6-dehydratase 2, partial [Frankliniella fusca]